MSNHSQECKMYSKAVQSPVYITDCPNLALIWLKSASFLTCSTGREGQSLCRGEEGFLGAIQ